MLSAALLACAMSVHPVTLEAIVRVESSGNPVAVNVNGLQVGQQPHPATPAEAERVATAYIRRGYSVDLGLMQVNSRNLPALGYTVAQVLDPCTNIRAGGTILAADYAGATRIYGEGQRALQAALSAYNTGSYWRGMATYVARYYGPTGVPALSGRVQRATVMASAPVSRRPSPAPLPLSPYTADTQVYAREAANVRIQ